MAAARVTDDWLLAASYLRHLLVPFRVFTRHNPRGLTP